MVDAKKEVMTAERLARNLGLLQAGAMISFDVITPAGQKAKFRSVFIGYLPKKYVLIQYPDPKKVGNFAVHIRQGMKVAVRGISEGHEGAVVAFASTIKQTVQNPSRIIVLEFPQAVGLQNLRNSMRVDTNIKASLVINKVKWQALITDLSLSGCQLYIENGEQLKLHNKASLNLFIENYHNINQLKLAVTMCNSKILPNALSIGVRFSPENTAQVERLLLNAMVDNG
jgi:c-di-GMP-binding flagellar brake protein YcgR